MGFLQRHCKIYGCNLVEQILTYRDEQQQQLQQGQTKVEVCAGADQTFFEQTVLVMLDLASGDIFVESQAFIPTL